LAALFLAAPLIAVASPPQMGTDEFLLKVIRHRGAKVMIVQPPEPHIFCLKDAGEPRNEEVWATDRWHQVSPVRVWNFEEQLLPFETATTVEVSKDGARTLLTKGDRDIAANVPEFVLATLMDNQSGRVVREIRLADVMLASKSIKQLPSNPPRYRWGLFMKLGAASQFSVFTCEGRKLGFSLQTGELISEEKLPHGRWAWAPGLLKFEAVCE